MYIYIYIYTHIICKHTTYTYIYIYIYTSYMYNTYNMYIHMHICIYIYIYTHTPKSRSKNLEIWEFKGRNSPEQREAPEFLDLGIRTARNGHTTSARKRSSPPLAHLAGVEDGNIPGGQSAAALTSLRADALPPL